MSDRYIRDGRVYKTVPIYPYGYKMIDGMLTGIRIQIGGHPCSEIPRTTSIWNNEWDSWWKKWRNVQFAE